MKLYSIPKHVAIIPDGNRRWAKARGLPNFEGHRRGFKRALDIFKKARQLGIKVISIWAFSTENWKRSPQEVNYLMKLYENMIDDHLKQALANKIKIIHIGRKDRISQALKLKIINAETRTKKFDKYYSVIALDYGGRDEIIRAINKIKEVKPKIKNLNKENFGYYLDTVGLPDPDLIIRTGGEKRLSGFLPWQSEYSELIFLDQYFPDFSPSDFETCVKEYISRQRRFGK